VTESESSYYEIALTNRQVMTVFVVLLLCVVAAFFSGVWIGRREAVPALAAAPAAEAAVAAVDANGEPMEELRFFSESAAAAPESGATQPVPQSGARPEPPPSRVEASGSVGVFERPPAEVARAEPEPEEAAPERPIEEGPLVIQVFSSADQQQAQRVVDRLRTAGYAALLSPVEVRDQTMYRVRIGPFGEEREAERVADRVRRDFKLDTWITRG